MYAWMWTDHSDFSDALCIMLCRCVAHQRKLLLTPATGSNDYDLITDLCCSFQHPTNLPLSGHEMNSFKITSADRLASSG
jgi:hypothetical protein